MTDAQSASHNMQEIDATAFPDVMQRTQYDWVRRIVQRNRAMIAWHSQQVKTQGEVFREIEERYLAKLIEAERVYEEELRAVFPNL